MVIGKKVWAIAEGYIPTWSKGPSPEMESHETVCILNTSEKTAHVEIMIYFTDRGPLGPFKEEILSKRARHIRFNSFDIPKGVDFASTIISDIEIVVQHTRLDSRQAENALLSTMAYSQ